MNLTARSPRRKRPDASDASTTLTRHRATTFPAISGMSHSGSRPPRSRRSTPDFAMY
jgi:hypothetical protein